MITDADAANARTMFVLTKSEKIKETRLKFSQKSNILIQDDK